MTITTAWPLSYPDPWADRTSLTLDLDDHAVRGLLTALGRSDAPRVLPDELARLTDRELTVLRAIATVKTHVARILAKLGVRDRVQAVVFAYESRLVVPR